MNAVGSQGGCIGGEGPNLSDQVSYIKDMANELYGASLDTERAIEVLGVSDSKYGGLWPPAIEECIRTYGADVFGIEVK